MDKKSQKNQQADELDLEVQQALDKLGIKGDWRRHISASEVLYLIDHSPFLQLIDTAPQMIIDFPPLQLMTAKSGWNIHNYGDALSSSPGLLLFGGGDFTIRAKDEDKGGKGGGVINPGKGTLINQAVMTAFEMIELAQQLGWAGIKIVDGHPLMIWAAWMQAEEIGMGLEGYTPSAQDLAKRQRIKRPRSEEISHRPSP